MEPFSGKRKKALPLPTEAKVEPFTATEASEWLEELLGFSLASKTQAAPLPVSKLQLECPSRALADPASVPSSSQQPARESRKGIQLEQKMPGRAGLSTPTAVKAPPPQRRAAEWRSLGPGASALGSSVPVKFCLPEPRERLAGQRLSHCVRVVDTILLKGLMVFKIGVTLDPQRRWFDPKMGYCRDPDFHTMVVLLEVDCGEAVGYVEAGLLLKYQSVPGCRNVGPGGEGINLQNPGPYYTYVVYRLLPQPP